MFGIQVKTEKISLKFINLQSKLNKLEEFAGCVTIEKKTLDYWRVLNISFFVFLVDLESGKIYYKRYISIVHELRQHTEEPFYLATQGNKFLAYVDDSKTCGFCRDLFFLIIFGVNTARGR